MNFKGFTLLAAALLFSVPAAAIQPFWAHPVHIRAPDGGLILVGQNEFGGGRWTAAQRTYPLRSTIGARELVIDLAERELFARPAPKR